MRVLREPLLHFFALGSLIFVAFAVTGDRRADAPGRIVVTAGRIEHLAAGFTRTWQRSPSAPELQGLIDDYVRDEVYYREAMASGLDRDDTVVRHRLRQKMEFLVEDATTRPLSEEALQAFLRAHPEKFRLEPQLAFRQVYLSRERRGDRIVADAGALATRLAAAGPGADLTDVGDTLMVPSDVDLSSKSEVARVFGDAFADALLDLPIGRWMGPIESGYGVHVVVVTARTDGRLPALDEVRDAVTREAQAAERAQMVDSAYATLRARYEVVVERPPQTGDGTPR